MDFVKNRAFYHVLCFLGGKSSKKRLFFGVLDKKESFLDQKKKVLKKYKKSKFSKGVSLSFLSKNRPFYRLCFLGKSIRIGKIIFLLFWIKRSFLDQKKEVLKKTKKNLNFLKGLVHGFCHILIKSSNWLYARYH